MLDAQNARVHRCHVAMTLRLYTCARQVCMTSVFGGELGFETKVSLQQQQQHIAHANSGTSGFGGLCVAGVVVVVVSAVVESFRHFGG